EVGDQSAVIAKKKLRPFGLLRHIELGKRAFDIATGVFHPSKRERTRQCTDGAGPGALQIGFRFVVIAVLELVESERKQGHAVIALSGNEAVRKLEGALPIRTARLQLKGLFEQKLVIRIMHER